MAGQPPSGEDSAPALKTSALHTAPDRRERFAGLRPKVWLEPAFIRTWVIAEPALIVELLRSPHADILDIEGMLGPVERAYRIEFPNLRFAARHLPLFLAGDIHAARRRIFSKYLAGRLTALEAALPELIARQLGPLRGTGRTELVSDVTGPLVREINSILVQCPVPKEINSLDLLDLFALNKSLARFKGLEARTGQAIAFLSRAGEDEELLGCRFTALVMGFETLLTMLTEGITAAFRDHRREADAPVTLPADPIETGVPLSYRRASADFELAGHAFKAGDLFRLQLQTLGYSTRAAERTRIFGAGEHSCVGKQVSLRIWTQLKQSFDALAVRGHVRSCEIMPSHYLLRHGSVHIEVF